jgi:phosphatidylserine/phosphatidylglycerophosphate/cardiolipin synthase-like enzyme
MLAAASMGTTGFIHYPEDAYGEGHSIYVTQNTDDATFWKFELLKNARKSIEMSAGYGGGNVLNTVYEIFKAQLERNSEIQIHFMVTQIGGLMTDGDSQRLRELAAKYPNNFHLNISAMSGLIIQANGLYTTENHMKLIVVDEKYFLLGGTNLVDKLSQSDFNENTKSTSLSDAFLPLAANDQDIVGSGPAAKPLREQFFQVFSLFESGQSLSDNAGPYRSNTTAYRPIPEEQKAQIALFDHHPRLVKNVKALPVVAGPRIHNHEIGKLYTYYIKQAQRSIDIANMYFFPVDDIYNPLIDAAKRDIAISVVTNGLRLKASTSNSTIALYAFINRMNYLPVMLGRTFRFWQEGDAKTSQPKRTSVYEYNEPYVLYHKKVMIVDNRISVVGSYNLGKKSENSDFEVVLFMDSPEVANNLLEIINDDKIYSVPISVKDALDWHFSFYYNVVTKFESFFFDGIILNVEELTKELAKEGIDYKDLGSDFKEHAPFPGIGGKDDLGWSK